MSDEIDIWGKPDTKFVLGQRYRLRNGSMSKPLELIRLSLMTDGDRVWNLQGRFSSKGPHEFDLMLDE